MADELETKATSAEGIGEISSEEELLQYISGSDNSGVPGGDGEDNLLDVGKQDNKTEDPKIKDTKIVGEDFGLGEEDKDKPKGDETDKAKEEGKEGEEKEYNNMIHYLDERFGLKMNLEELPKELEREDEAKIVADIYDRLFTGAQQQLSQYKQIDEILKDKEVSDFIKAKAEGKTFNQFIEEYAGATAGKTSEQIVKDNLKATYPGMTEEDINNTIEGYKDRNMLEKMADIARGAEIERVKKEKEEREINDKKAKDDAERQRMNDVKEFTDYVGKISKVYGVPVDQKMRSGIISAVTELDENGQTYLDKALQSDAGVVRATLGLLYLDQLMQADKTLTKNRIANSVVDRLLTDPKELQSSSNVKREESFDPEAANSF